MSTIEFGREHLAICRVHTVQRRIADRHAQNVLATASAIHKVFPEAFSLEKIH